jgi:hypothetical protein
VYDSLVFLVCDQVNGLIVIVSGNRQASLEPTNLFLGAVPKVERHLALTVGFSVSNEEE